MKKRSERGEAGRGSIAYAAKFSVNITRFNEMISFLQNNWDFL